MVTTETLEVLPRTIMNWNGWIGRQKAWLLKIKGATDEEDNLLRECEVVEKD